MSEKVTSREAIASKKGIHKQNLIACGVCIHIKLLHGAPSTAVILWNLLLTHGLVLLVLGWRSLHGAAFPAVILWPLCLASRRSYGK